MILQNPTPLPNMRCEGHHSLGLASTCSEAGRTPPEAMLPVTVEASPVPARATTATRVAWSSCSALGAARWLGVADALAGTIRTPPARLLPARPLASTHAGPRTTIRAAQAGGRRGVRTF